MCVSMLTENTITYLYPVTVYAFNINGRHVNFST